MKVLVYGGKGWIGDQMIGHLERMGHQPIIAQARADDYDGVSRELDEIRPDRVFSSIGRTYGTHNGKSYPSIDYLELPGHLSINLRDNLIGPITLAELCQKRGIHLTYIGTGCIFNYDDQHTYPGDSQNPYNPKNYEVIKGFTEQDAPNFFGSSYSIVKGQTDQLMNRYDDTVLNCRIRMPITADYNSRNFITKILKYEKICNVQNSMTILPQILPIIVKMMENGETSTYCMTNPGTVSHNEILDRYREKIDPGFKYNNFSLEEQDKILLSKRSNNYLETKKLENYCSNHGLKLNNIQEGMDLVINEIAKEYGKLENQ